MASSSVRCIILAVTVVPSGLVNGASEVWLASNCFSHVPLKYTALVITSRVMGSMLPAGSRFWILLLVFPATQLLMVWREASGWPAKSRLVVVAL